MATAQELITDALSHSSANRPDVLATQATELLGQLNIEVGRVFAFARDVDPTYIAAITTVALTGNGWPFPANCYTVTRLEGTGNPAQGGGTVPSGAEVTIVPYDDRALEAGSPSVYEYGQVFYSAGNDGDPVSGDLRVFFARTPTEATGLGSTVDTPWPSEFTHIIVLGLAAYLAQKDGRTEEATAMGEEQSAVLGQFRQHIRSRVASTRQRFGMFRPQQVDADPET